MSNSEKYIVGITNDQTYIFYYNGNINNDTTIYEDKCTLVEYEDLNTAIDYMKEKVRIMEIWNNDNKWKIFYYNYLKNHIFDIKYRGVNFYDRPVYSINVSLSKVRKEKLKKIKNK